MAAQKICRQLTLAATQARTSMPHATNNPTSGETSYVISILPQILQKSARTCKQYEPVSRELQNLLRKSFIYSWERLPQMAAPNFTQMGGQARTRNNSSLDPVQTNIHDVGITILTYSKNSKRKRLSYNNTFRMSCICLCNTGFNVVSTVCEFTYSVIFERKASVV